MRKSKSKNGAAKTFTCSTCGNKFDSVEKTLLHKLNCLAVIPPQGSPGEVTGYTPGPYHLEQVMENLALMHGSQDLVWCRWVAHDILERGIDALPTAQAQSRTPLEKSAGKTLNLERGQSGEGGVIQQPASHVFLFVEGGVVKNVLTDSPVRVTLIDYDVEGADPARVQTVPDLDGQESEAFVVPFVTENNPEWHGRLLAASRDGKAVQS